MIEDLELENKIVNVIVKKFPDLIKKEENLYNLFKKIIDESILNIKFEQLDHRIVQLTEELRFSREEEKKRWEQYLKDKEEYERRWRENQAEIVRLREESERKWEEYKKEREKEREEDQKRWAQYFTDKEEYQRRWEQYLKDKEEYERRWRENQAEIVRLREESERKWEEYKKEREKEREEDQKRWAQYFTDKEEYQRRWEQYLKEREEHQERWNQYLKDREEYQKRWDQYLKDKEEYQKDKEENERRWRENQIVIQKILEEIKDLKIKYEVNLGGIGARWGYMSESAFRDGLKNILEHSFPVKVERFVDFDSEGFVFGKPDTIELDLIIKNGEIIVSEIKSSFSRSDVYTFLKKVDYYEKKYNKKINRKIIISPMIDPKAERVILENHIEAYSFPKSI